MSATVYLAQALQDTARDSLDLWHAFIIGLPALAGVFATLIITVRGNQKAAYNRDQLMRKADITIDQVVNSHTTNLRDEITTGFREVRSDIRQIRSEIGLERNERIEGDKVRRGE